MSSVFDNLKLPFEFPSLIERIAEAVPAFESQVAAAKSRLRELASGPGARSTSECERALDTFDEILRGIALIVSVVSHLESVVTSDQVRTANEKIQELNAEWVASLYADPELYRYFSKLTPSASDERTHKNLLFAFESSGAKLDAEKRERFIKIEQELSELTTKFSQAVVDSTKEWSWTAIDRSELPGLLESDLEAASDAAKIAGKPGYLFTLQAPSYRAIASFHRDAKVREKFVRAYARRASAPPYDNAPIIERVLALRSERAQLLGYKNFVDSVVFDRMAKHSSSIREFFDSLAEPVARCAKRDIETLTTFAHRGGHPKELKLEAWDMPFWMQRYEEQELGLNPEEIREYFPFEPTLDRIFSLLESVFGVAFTPKELSVWWSGVQSFSAQSKGKMLGTLYTDYYARDNKRAGAWMDMLLSARSDGTDGVGLMAGNFSKPAAGKPALLTHDEITTLFHEAGHLLHGLVCRTRRAQEGMLNVAWDFVEVPSQLLENWAWEPVVLRRITSHYKTGAPMPEHLIEKLVRSRHVLNGIFYARHLANSACDLELHTSYSPKVHGDAVTWSREFIRRFVPFTLDDSAMLNSFTHLFSEPEGYAGGYYSYLWSEALEADIFSAFAGDSVLDRRIGERFVEQVLMPGDSVDALELFRNFMGRDPNPAALLRRIDGR